MLDTTQRINFLKKLHLFRGLKDEELIPVADEFVALPLYTTSEVVFSQDSHGDALFVIFSGKVTITQATPRNHQSRAKKIATLVAGDYFGEEALVTKQKRSATVTAEPGTLLLKLGIENYKRLVKKFPDIKHNFEVVVSSRRKARRLMFSWLQSDEIIYYLAGRHPITIINWIAAPILTLIVLLLLGGIILLYYPQPWPAGVLAGLCVFNLFWLIWQWVDWSNDYYIVTNERVVRTEKVIALYDSREEAPLSTVISVTSDTAGPFQRQIGLGNVVVRTFTSQITMYDVSHPYQVESMIQEYWNRTKEKIQSVEKGAIRKALLNKINPPPPKPIEAAPPPAKPKQESYATSISRMLFANFLKVRFEDSNVVTYRKHWFVLLRNTFKQFVLFILLISAPFLWVSLLHNWFPGSGWSIWTLCLLSVFGWWLYDYVDWVNDVYKVTPDQIIDINKKPLGKEQRKSAPLDSIMSTSYERRGILGLVLNYGIVKIKVGAELFDFVDVFDPPQVEQDIIRRLGARKQKKAEAEKVAEAERMGTWLANYDQIAKELRDEKQSQNSHS
jgi:hypothetical protein